VDRGRLLTVHFALQTPSPDSIRTALRQVLSDRAYQWTDVADPWRALKEIVRRLNAWLQDFGDAHPLGRDVLIAASVLVLVAILVHLSYVIYRVLRSRPETSRATFQAPQREDDAFHLGRARQLAAEGRYLEAIADRFTAILLRLDRRRIVQYHASKTPAEYLSEAPELAGLVTALYRHVFGGVPCGPDDWTRFDQTAGALA
jgi:hypothetical protein